MKNSKKKNAESKEIKVEELSTKCAQPTEYENHECHRGRPKSKRIKGIVRNHEFYLGILLDGYIAGDFCTCDGEEVCTNDLELTPLVEFIGNSQFFLTKERTPMSISTVRKLADKEWQKHKEVKHYQKHKKKPDEKKENKGGNKK